MNEEILPEFPDAFLSIRKAYIYGKPGEWAIIIVLKPFELDGEGVETQITLDAFPWGVRDPLKLAGMAYDYSADDRDKHNIEGSICLRHAHHPVDVSRIALGKAEANTVQATIDCNFDFDCEGAGFRNRSARITCELECGVPKEAHSYRVIK
ncbi:MAG: hypothetical protein ACM359_20530 [Bacillota bacterium]